MIRNFALSHKSSIYDNVVEIYQKLFNVNLDFTNKQALILAISTLKYGQIYPISRGEAKMAILLKDWNEVKNQIEYFQIQLQQKNCSNLIMNQAIAKAIRESKNTHHNYQDMIADNSYCSIKSGDIVYKKDDFHSRDDLDYLDDPKFDLHDEGHYVMGQIDERFGYKLQSPYFESALSDIPEFKYILNGESKINHNLFFNKIGYFAFYNYLYLDKGEDVESLIQNPDNFVEAISGEVIHFLTTGEFVEYNINHDNRCEIGRNKNQKSDQRSVTPKELAVLTQIMFSEAGSSEIGEDLYTRGSPSGKRSKYQYDILIKLNAVEKIQMIASLFEAKNQGGDTLKLHHENRSTLRIRGILVGYLKYAKILIKESTNTKDVLLIRKIIEQIEGVYLGRSKEYINLFEAVEENKNNPKYYESYSEFVIELKEKIIQNPNQIIAISGSSASGKSTLLEKIQSQIPNLNLVSLDDFQKGKYFVEDTNHPLKFDHKSNLNLEEVNTLFDSFKSGEPYILPRYSFVDGVATNNLDITDNRKILERKVLIIEGIFANLREVRSKIDLSCFIEAPFYQTFVKRVIRDRERFKGTKTDSAILTTMIDQVYESYKTMILPQKVNANVIIRSEFDFNYLIRLFRLKPLRESQKILQLLSEDGAVKVYINNQSKLIISFQGKVYYTTQLDSNLKNKLINTNFNN
jgi:uridine kinase